MERVTRIFLMQASFNQRAVLAAEQTEFSANGKFNQELRICVRKYRLLTARDRSFLHIALLL